MKLRIIGDVHGKTNEYLSLAKQADYSIQLGDLSFNYDFLSELNSDNHKVIPGNHDNYEVNDNGDFINHTNHFLGDFGTYSLSGLDFFFIRGGNSIDKESRTENYNWWANEEISYVQGIKALDKYGEVKPDTVLSHECPTFIIDMISGHKTWNGLPIRPSMTANLLDQMFECHKPKLWIFGHHHKDFKFELEGTMFICLPELAFMDFEI